MSNTRDNAKVDPPTRKGGSITGALAGGGKGAAIGAGVGAGSEIITKGDQVKIPSETLLDFTLQQGVTIPKHAADRSASEVSLAVKFESASLLIEKCESLLPAHSGILVVS